MDSLTFAAVVRFGSNLSDPVLCMNSIHDACPRPNLSAKMLIAHAGPGVSHQMGPENLNVTRNGFL